jgi:hypothetical protein
MLAGLWEQTSFCYKLQLNTILPSIYLPTETHNKQNVAAISQRFHPSSTKPYQQHGERVDKFIFNWFELLFSTLTKS